MHQVEPRFLLLEGTPGRFAIANWIFGRRFHLRGYTFPMIPDPRFGFLFRIHASGGIGCSSATVDEAIDEFKYFFHVQRLLEAPCMNITGYLPSMYVSA